MHDPRVGRFFAVDPLEKKYPWYTPYQFSGNRVIDAFELEGLEPSKNFKKAGVKELKAIAVVKGIQKGAETWDKLINGADYLNPFDEDENGLIGQETYMCNSTPNYITDTSENSANKFNMFVSDETKFRVDESNADRYTSYESMVVSTLMDNFVSGKGPENYYFPENGIISSQFLDSDILKKAIDKFKKGDLKLNEPMQINFNANDLINDTKRNGTIFNITGLVGSGQITIIKTEKAIKIQIFNITSLSSGDLIKNPNDDNTWSKSLVRDPKKVTPYGNISQTFNLSFPLE